VGGFDRSLTSRVGRRIQNIPQEALERDYEELQTFREMPEEWDAH
jgi:hypothetical protein